MIAGIVGLVVLGTLGALAGLVWWLGFLGGLAVFALILSVVVVTYLRVLRPWHLRWGATDEETARPMPGDELIPDIRPATRAITIHASVEDVWPWLMQLGYSRAGWYSYDWIDNDFRHSADEVLPEFQGLAVGDRILMAPKMGLTVNSIDPFKSIVSVMDDGNTSWCLALYPIMGDGTRLVSRWRPKLKLPLPAMAIVEPGTFIMEQKMLRTIRDRVERRVRAPS